MMGKILLTRFFFAVAVIGLTNTASADTIASSNKCSGIWAALAQSPFIDSNIPLQDILAPNGFVSINSTNEGLVVVGRRKNSRLEEVIGNPTVTEVLWSPDSGSFVVNESEGGAVGLWNTYLYFIDRDDHPVYRNIEGLIRPLVDKVPQCDPPEDSNIGTVAWLNNGKELLLVATVPPHSVCRNMGQISGFRVSIESWKILERIPEKKLRKKWANYLGCQFAKTTDSSGHR
jgi:hypothetical protein